MFWGAVHKWRHANLKIFWPFPPLSYKQKALIYSVSKCNPSPTIFECYLSTFEDILKALVLASVSKDIFVISSN